MMNKEKFLKELGKYLRKAHIVDDRRYIQDYAELISDLAESKSVSEDKVAASLDNPQKIVSEIINEDHPQMAHLSIGIIVLIVVALVLGSPLWGSLLFFLFMFVVFGYFLIWLVPALFCFGTGLTLFLGVYGLLAATVAMFKVTLAIGCVELGFSLVALGTTLILAKLTWWSTKYFSTSSISFFKWLVSKFRRYNHVAETD